MSPLRIAHNTTATGPVLHVNGELDYEHARALREHAQRCALAPEVRLTIDLSGLQFCDSTGLSTLLAVLHHAQAAGSDLTLTAVPADTLRILTSTGLDQVFTLQPAAAPG
ncbi:STAS domain-containing protein [Streptomyces sp. NPDC049813]|uniref:STAS domain-containing protein n=1 Tax=Streptomyces sp. NPDC049813 TaxID=3365597 RepID=UPI00379BFF51